MKNMNKKEIRRAARTVIIDQRINEIGILEVKNGDYHKIPGGGIEGDENLEETALREALEEGASDVELITKLGEHEFESPEFPGLYNHSVCFLARKIEDHPTPRFTLEEQENKFQLLWLTFDEAISLFENVKSSIPFELEMNNRDLNFVKQAKEYLTIHKR